ncbi:MAG: hypothetical protein FD167_555 [bacterium]|nr:MAG: hypothetical protein FD167_555 [bacterium]
MLTKKITAVGNSGAVLLSKDLLAILDVKIGDEVEIKVVDDALILRSMKQEERSEKFNLAAKKVLEKRRSALVRLAKDTNNKNP